MLRSLIHQALHFRRLCLFCLGFGLGLPVSGQSVALWSRDFYTGTGNNQYSSMRPSVQDVRDTLRVAGVWPSAQGDRLGLLYYLHNGTLTTSLSLGANGTGPGNKIVSYLFDAAENVYILHKQKLAYYKSKLVLQKYAPNGSLLWVQEVAEVADTSYSPRDMALVNDSTVLLRVQKEHGYPEQVGDDWFNIVISYELYAFSKNGSKLWQRKPLPNPVFGFMGNLVVKNDTAFVFCFYNGYVLLKYDAAGNLLQNSPLSTTCKWATLTVDNNLLFISGPDYRFSKVDLNGNLLWTRYVATNLPPNVSGDGIARAIQDAAGNTYVTGTHAAAPYNPLGDNSVDLLTQKYDASGNLLWSNRRTSSQYHGETGYYLFYKNGQLYVGGDSKWAFGYNFDFILQKIDAATGMTTGEYTYSGPGEAYDAVTGVYVFEGGQVALTGVSYVNGQMGWTTQWLDEVVLSTGELLGVPRAAELWPNPVATGGQVYVQHQGAGSYVLLNAEGQLLQKGTLGWNATDQLRLEAHPPGLYVLKVTDAGGSRSIKFLIR